MLHDLGNGQTTIFPIPAVSTLFEPTGSMGRRLLQASRVATAAAPLGYNQLAYAGQDQLRKGKPAVALHEYDMAISTLAVLFCLCLEAP